MAIVDLETYKLLNQISSHNNDNRLEIIVPLVNNFIEEYCGRVFESDSFTESATGDDCIIYAANPPIISVSKIEYFSLDNTWEELDSENYLVNKQEGFVELLGTPRYKKVNRPFKITYVGGFDEIPSALKLAAFDLVTYYYKRESTPRKIVGNQQSTNSEPEYNKLPAHIKRVLDLYRIIEF